MVRTIWSKNCHRWRSCIVERLIRQRTQRDDQWELTKVVQGQLTTHRAIKKQNRKQKEKKNQTSWCTSEIENPHKIWNMNSTKERTAVTYQRKTSGKQKVRKSRMTGQHLVELSDDKDWWNITLNTPTGNDKSSVMASTKLSQIHWTHSYGALIASWRKCPRQD